jgi:hypothetical protein
VPEMVFLLGRMGSNKQALMLIIQRLGDVQRVSSSARARNHAPDIYGTRARGCNNCSRAGIPVTEDIHTRRTVRPERRQQRESVISRYRESWISFKAGRGISTCTWMPSSAKIHT